jgi:ribonuclease HI
MDVSQVPLFELTAAAVPEVAISKAAIRPGASKTEAVQGDVKLVTVYTDGGCQPNPGPGGWGAVLIFNGMEKELYGYEADTTNNRMELTGAIRALEALREPCRVKLHSDSALLINAFTQNWIPGWQRKGWVNASKEPVKNRDLWEQLIELSRRHQVEWIKVKGHAGVHYNERCDQLCAIAIREGKG